MTPFAMFVLLSATAMVLIGSDRRRPTGFKAAAIVLCTGAAIYSLSVALLEWWVYG